MLFNFLLFFGKIIMLKNGEVFARNNDSGGIKQYGKLVSQTYL